MEINKEEVLNTIKKNYNKYTFKLGEFIIPKELGHLDIYNLRQNLLKNRSPGELSLVSDFCRIKNNLKAGKSGTYIEQFPIPICDKDLWVDCCRTYDSEQSYDRNNYPLTKKKLLVPDIYLPYQKLAIEVDYPSTHPDKNIDLVRDLYLYRMYKIITFRVNCYSGGITDSDKMYQQCLGFFIKNTSYTSKDKYEIFDFREAFIKGFEQKFRLILENQINPTKEFNMYLKKK